MGKRKLNTAGGPPAPPPPPPMGHPGIPGQPVPYVKTGGGLGTGMFGWFNEHVMYLNQSKYFAGLIMIMLNIGSKFVSVQFSKSAEEYFKMNVTKQILVFSMAWMATRDIYTALVITAVFVVLSEHLFNEESRFCVVPHKYRVLGALVDTNGDGIISDEELKKAEETLEKARRQKQIQDRRHRFMQFELEKNSE